MGMTIEEAIKHCEEVAEKNEEECKNWAYGASRINDDESRKKQYLKHAEMWQECANEHRQLAEWLRELVHLRNITEYLRDFIDCFGSMDSMYYNEDIIKWAEEELRVEMREVNADDT